LLNERTLFVLGAGASVDFGMPLGDRLSTTIANKVDIKFDRGLERPSGDPDIMEALRAIAKREEVDPNLYRAAGCSIASGIGYSRSIDGYLSAHDDNKYVKVCAKLAIVQSILESERGSDLSVDQSRANATFKDYEKVMGSWLNDFMYLLSSGVAKGKNLDRIFDFLVIVNFNYDRLIEQFFWYALKDLFQISESDAAELVRNKLKILRPYGKVGELPMGGTGVPFGARLQTSQLEAISNDIRTFNEQIEDEELLAAVHEEVEKCDRVVFLGFHFHKQNMDFLTPKGMKFRDPGRTPRSCYGTATTRSGPDVQVIQSRIRNAYDGQIQGVMEIGNSWGCKEIFKMYATTWGA
jgi:hypothetical protein